METYIILGNYTQQGIKNVKDSPARVEAARQAIEAAGGKFLAFYTTLGQYDFVIIVQVPRAEVGLALLLATGSAGNIRTATLRAFTEEEAANIIANLP